MLETIGWSRSFKKLDKIDYTSFRQFFAGQLPEYFKEKNPEIFLSLCKEEEKLVRKSIESLENNDIDTLGKCMSQNQIYLEQLGVSNERLLSIIKSVETTSLGTKITGAGDGGCLIMLVDPKIRETAINNLDSNSHEYFSVKIDHDGVQIFN